MKIISYLIITFLLILPYKSYATDFIDGFEDVPLMDGLKQENNQDFSFGNEESGYTETLLIASRLKNFVDIKLFYKDVLPKFGWTLVSESDFNLSFTRENDILDISRQQIKPLKVLVCLKSEN